MNRRTFLRAAGAAAASVLFAKAAKAQRGQRPNALFLFADDQRFDTLRALDNPHIHTPNLDALVKQGTSFTQAYILGSPSGAVCGPSRAMVLTGRSYFKLPNSVTMPWDVPQEEKGRCPYPTMPEVFRAAGYATFGTGKWHNGPPLYAKGFTHGGAIFFGGMGDHYRLPLLDFAPSGKYPTAQEINELTLENLRKPAGKHATDVFGEVTVDFIKTRPKDRPFFAYVAFTAPHDPRTMPKEHLDHYNPDGLPLPDNFLPEHPFDNGELKIRDERLAPWPRTPAIVRKQLADYYAMITHVDAQAGKILAALDATGERENTIVVFAGDNGLAVGQHGLFGKQNLYEHSIGVPLVFSGPGIPRGERRDAPCYLHDLFPTLCDMAGLETPGPVESQSLLPLVRDAAQRGRKTLAFAYRDYQRALREGRYKLIAYHVKGVRTTQLFDLEADPWEKRNLAGAPAHAPRIARMRAQLQNWEEEPEDSRRAFWKGSA